MKKIVIIGPESTGKSTLCAELAKHFNTLWCPEFAREYLLQNGTHYNVNDLTTIAKGQLAKEDDFTDAVNKHWKSSTPKVTNTPVLFIDTDMLVMKVWSEFVFNLVDPFILHQIEKRKYDLYLLCNTDLPWTKDELREYPDVETRQKLFIIYKSLLIHQNVPFIEIKGMHQQRLETAIAGIQQFLPNIVA
jgi:NadR type nicotinamide-nucleotide adenylyltransferase